MAEPLAAGAGRLPLRMLALGITLALLCYALLLGTAELSALGRALERVPGLLLAQLLALALASYLLRFCRWQYLLVAQGQSVAIWRSLEIYLSAFALTLTPGKLGELVRSVYLLPLGVPLARSIAAFFAERLLDVLSVALLASLAVLLFPAYQYLLGLLLLGFLALLLACALAWPERLLRRFARPLLRRFPQLPTLLPFLLSGRRLAWALPLGLLAWAAQGLLLAQLVAALGYALSAWVLLGVYCLSLLAGAASLLPGGIGVTETSMLLLLVALGLSYEDALLAALLCRGLTLWLALSLGLLTMGRLACGVRERAGKGCRG